MLQAFTGIIFSSTALWHNAGHLFMQVGLRMGYLVVYPPFAKIV